ncbi:unnamed protein product, partial [Amoebophrya sp. A25]
LCLAPTKEQTVAIYELCQELLHGHPGGLKCAMAVAGVPRNHLLSAMREANLWVATPRRFFDFLTAGQLPNVSAVSFCAVLDLECMLEQNLG